MTHGVQETSRTLPEPPRVSGGGDLPHGHLEELRTDPIALMRRVREECGDVGAFQLADRTVILLSGAEANEFFFRSTDEDLDQQAAYPPFMKPIFGEGVVFDASPERRKEMLHNSALRGEHMRGHAATIGREVEAMVAQWGGDEGEIDLLDFFAELTIYTSSACLIGKKFRDELDDSFAKLYHELEQGTDALAFVDPYAPIESFRRRDEARLALVALVQDIMNGRIANPPQGKDDRDMLDVLVSVKDENGDLRFSADEITGIFISMMFAGHHTTSGTAAWSLIEMLRHPDTMTDVVDELDNLYSDGADISFHALRQIPVLEAVVKETLRLHPPLIILLRVARGDFEVGGFEIREGHLVAATPAISNRIAEDFPPAGHLRSREVHRPESRGHRQPLDVDSVRSRPASLRRRCVRPDAAQSDLLDPAAGLRVRDGAASESYRNDHSKMVVQLQQPCAVRYRRRTRPGREGG